MAQKRFSSGAIRIASYKAAEKELELTFQNGSIKLYRSVPAAVWERLCAAPNPASYWEDRIAEEYPERKLAAAGKPGARAQLEAMFGETEKTDQ
ncbi:MAG: KTSC domain-containing protein [Betaproteobacteria bacterium]|jgi:hypothetical protein|nr:KTSC domain-containing protein [Pseudomonadota bacterium]NBO04233.1 KTSC domain-containing protein [Betaproteobacteria bacterium]NDG05178.1 KTSC domain-containing protein [Alphaproteobacteria bacterium]NBP35876.1 KTSC domain-containing protein [Betaproteobacteria bacterium]NBP37645.1 KTSC domain-containing protein [Betaproteobacteria bacterium]